MRFDSYMVQSVEGMVDDGNDTINMAVRPSSVDANMIRKIIMETQETINEYIEKSEKAENDVVRKIFLDIAEEERVHFGELEMLLEAVDPLHKPSKEGEIEDIMNEEYNE